MKPTLRRTILPLCALLCSCSLFNDLEGYSGGTKDASSADSAIDTTADTTPAETGDASPDAIVDAPDSGTDGGTDGTTDDGTDGGDGATDASDAGDSGADAGDASDASDAAEAVEAGSCGSVCGFGLSEIMAHVISGTGDKHEWIELTNYTSGVLDVSGVTVKVFNSSSPPAEKAAYTFPAGTTLAAGEAVVIADDDVTLKGEVSSGYVLGKVFSFGKTAGDVLINSAVYLRLYAPGVSAPYEDAFCSRSTWTLFRSYAYPPPSSTCPSSARLTGTGTLAAPWKDTPVDGAQKYGEFPTGTSLYGTPTKPNSGIACP